jgi:putative N-acetylmannosamine-6-phosphate epimerase
MKHVIALENSNDSWKTANAEDIKRQAQAGIQVITFDAATAKQYVDKAYDVAWSELIKKSPTYGPQLKKLFSK